MISIYKLKPRFRQLLTPLMASLHKAGLSPNDITILSIALSLALGIFFWNADKNPWFLFLIPSGLLLRMMLNAIDGLMATTYNLQSKKGEVLNEMGDLLSDLFIYIPLIKFSLDSYIIIAFIILALLNETAGILSKAVSGKRRYDGPMGKSDRAFLVSAYCILFYFIPDIFQYSLFYFSFACVFMIISTILRLKNSLK